MNPRLLRPAQTLTYLNWTHQQRFVHCKKKSATKSSVHVLINSPALPLNKITQNYRFYATSNLILEEKVKESTMSSNNSNLQQIQTPESAVLRYSPADERFQLKLIHGGKIFNFDRCVTDTIQTVLDRMTVNISKKIKTFEQGSISLLTSSKESEEEEWNDCDKSLTISNILKELLNGSRLNIKIAPEDVYAVSVNPPEVFSMKFLKQATVGFPVIPYKVETSGNFQQELSKFSWEFTKKSKNTKAQPQKKNKMNKKSNNSTVEEAGWMDTGCRDFIFTPGMEHIGARLRVTCVPSDGVYFGLPFVEEIPEIVGQSTVEPLYKERLARMTEANKAPNFFRVVSYNCLADCYATPEWFIASPKESLPADFRIPFLCRELFEYQSDVYCLQEIDAKFFEKMIGPFLKQEMDLEGMFSCKTGNMKEGVATFYNPRKLQLINQETIALLDHMKTMPFWNHLLTSVSDNFPSRLEDRNTVLQISIYRPTSTQNTNTILIVANTHLYFHPDADHIRLLQTISAIDYIQTLTKSVQEEFKDYDVNVLFCGDFNCTPPYSSYRYLTSGKINEDDFDWTSHPTEKISGISRQHNLQFTSAHPTQDLTNITTCFEGCIDYMLYQQKSFELLNSYPPPNKELLASIMELKETRQVSLPNFHTPSDHLPIIADFLLKPKN